MLSKLSIKKPLLIVVIIIVIIALGVVSYINTPIDLLPEMDLPFIVIVTVFPGAAPDIVEKDITIPIEGTVAKVSGIKKMSSTSAEHYSMITLELTSSADGNKVKQDIEAGLKLTSLPSDPLCQDPIIIEVSADLLPMMTLSIGVENENIEDISDYIGEVISRISAVDGVASASANGLVSNFVLMNLDSRKTAKAFVEGITQAFGIKIELPARIKENLRLWFQEILAEAQVNPDLSTDGRLDSLKIFDRLLENLDSLQEGAEGRENFIATLISSELRSPDSQLRAEILSAIDLMLENQFILNDNEDCKKVFDDIVDQAFYNGLMGVAYNYSSSMLSMINSDILSMIIMAQDFDMPAGSITKGATSFIVKIGDNINSRKDFMETAAVSIDIGNIVKEYLNAAEQILTLLSYASQDGVYSISEEQIALFSASLAAPGVEDRLTFLQDIVGDEIYELIVNATQGRSAQEINDMIIALLDILQEYGGEGAVTVQEGQGQLLYDIDVIVLKETIVAIAENLTIDLKLKDIADMLFLNDASKLSTRLLINDGKGNFSSSSSVVLVIEKEADASTVEVSAGVQKLLAAIADEHQGFTYNIISDDGDMINFMMDTVLESLLWGALLAIIVLLLFFRRIKPTLAVAISILFSVVFTFVLMYFANITLNIVSMGGLALGVGMLVDNSIVVIENIQRLRLQGKTRFEASIQGAKQMSSAIFASTMTTMVVFLPIIFIKGLVKEIMTDMALTVCFSLLASLFVALSLIPIATSYLIKEFPKSDFKSLKAIKKVYIKTLNFSLNNKWLVMGMAFILFAGITVGGFVFSKNEIFPETYMGYVGVNFRINKDAIDELNFGLSVMDDNYKTKEDIELEISQKAIEVFNKYPDIQAVAIYTSSGLEISGFSIGGGELSASLSIVPEKQRTMTPFELCEDLERSLNAVGGKLFSATADSNSILAYSAAFAESEYNIYMYGNDYELMIKEADALSELIGKSEKVNSVVKGVDTAAEEYKLIVDKDKASKYGLTTAQVYLQISEALKGISSSHTLRLYSDSSNTVKSDYDVMIYSEIYTNTSWYLAEQNGVPVKVFVKNNYDYYGAENEYYIKNPTEKTLFVEDNDKVKVVPAGGLIPVKLAEGCFTYKYAEAQQGIEEDTVTVKYISQSLTFSEKTQFYSVKREEVDLISLNIVGADILETGKAAKNVPLYKLLSNECFAKDSLGNVLYRRGRTEDIPASLVRSSGYTGIKHSEGRKVIALTIRYDDVYSRNDIEKEVASAVAEYNNSKPATVSVETKQSKSIMDEVMSNLYLILGAAIILIYLIMVAQFQSWKKPFIVMFTVPLAFTGSFALMLLTGTSINIMSLVGIIILMGVVVNNGIVFVDYADKLMEAGADKREALLRTGIDRLRPILLTALTTISALIIMATNTSDYGLLLAPIAISMVGGLTYATFVTLFVVPIAYDIVNRRYKIPEQVQALKDANIDKIDDDNIFEETDTFYAQEIKTTILSNQKKKVSVRKSKPNKKIKERQGYRSFK